MGNQTHFNCYFIELGDERRNIGYQEVTKGRSKKAACDRLGVGVKP